MLKRVALLSLALVMVLSMVSIASAALDVASTSQKGSLLVFPKIAVLQPLTPPIPNETHGAVDTYIFIGNDSPLPTWVKCYWMDQNQSIEDFHFYLTANQPVVFSASEGAPYIGPPFGREGVNTVGSLVCWAQDEKDQNPVKVNHLYGYAMIKEAIEGSSVFYNASAFALRGNPPVFPNPVLPLNGATYDQCPKYLVANFLTGWYDADRQNSSIIPAVKPDLTLWPCKQDLRQDRIPTCTKAKFDVWNGHEVKFTGAYACFKCFFEGYLEQIGFDGKAGYSNKGKKNSIYGKGPGFGYDKFVGEYLRTPTARTRIIGISSSVCDGWDPGSTTIPKTKGCVDADGKNVKSVNTPFLGVLLYGDGSAADINPAYIHPRAGYSLTGAGVDPDGFIKWDPAGTVEKKVK